jgi:hypothetical protein
VLNYMLIVSNVPENVSLLFNPANVLNLEGMLGKPDFLCIFLITTKCWADYVCLGIVPPDIAFHLRRQRYYFKT